MAITYRTLPVPAFAEYTACFVAGAVTIGVEYRHLDEDVIMDFYGPDARAKFGGVTPTGMDGVVTEDGLSLHVFATSDGAERLRFDCFDESAHYHLLDPDGPVNVVIEHDAGLHGPLLPWALDALRRSLGELLVEAGASELAASMNADEVAGVLGAVALEAEHMLAAGKPVRVT